MDDGTSQSRCRICGHPLNRTNRTGLCSNRTPECRKAREHLTPEDKPGKMRITIVAGDTFGKWTALEPYRLDSKDVLVRCVCGLEERRSGMLLVNGHSLACRSCGQKFKEKPARPPYLLAGTVAGRLTTLETAANCSDRILCRCECGREDPVAVWAVAVKFAHTRSCGCLPREARTKHGLHKHPLYSLWHGVIQRCTNPDSQSYFNYGGRGIRVCDRWLDVAAFVEDIEREIGARPEGKHKSGRALYELDRIDNDGGYCCGRCRDCAARGYVTMNVRWSDRPTQMRNRRKVPKLTQDILRLTRERDDLAAELAALKAQMAGTLF